MCFCMHTCVHTHLPHTPFVCCALSIALLLLMVVVAVVLA